MDLNRLPVIVSRDVPADEAWVIRRNDAPELPDDLRGHVRVPCILTGCIKSLKDTLKLMRLAHMATPRFRYAPGAAVKLHLESLEGLTQVGRGR